MGNKSGWIRWLPGLLTLRRYHVSWLAHDVVAGIMLATMLVPRRYCHAVASGLPGICGLHATIVPLLAYALFGPSRILVLGPDSSWLPSSLWDGWRPHSAVLGRAEGVKGYHDITRYPNARQIPGLVLFRWNAPYFSPMPSSLSNVF